MKGDAFDRWRIMRSTNNAGGVNDQLLPPNRGDAVATFTDRELADSVARLLNWERESQTGGEHACPES